MTYFERMIKERGAKEAAKLIRSGCPKDYYPEMKGVSCGDDCKPNGTCWGYEVANIKRAVAE